MTRPVLTRSPAFIQRKKISLPEDPKKETNGKRAGEVIGGSVAECTAVCCCFPCTVMELLVLGLYKVPTGLCKKAWKKTKQRRLKKKNMGLLCPAKVGPTRAELEPEAEMDLMVAKGDDHGDGCAGAGDLEKEMCHQLHGTGFWRSDTQRET